MAKKLTTTQRGGTTPQYRPKGTRQFSLDKMKKLRAKGLFYKEIAEIIGCNHHTVMYYLKGLHEHRANVANEYRKKDGGVQNKLIKKISAFKRERNGVKTSRNPRNHKGYKFTVAEVKKKFGETPECYLTGRKLCWEKTKDLHFDHIKPVSRGGSGRLSNLGLLCPEANYSKRDRTVKEHLDYCVEVLNHHGYLVEEPKT